jgi:uncharacterized protein YbjT (DUF2867 family)
MFRSRHVEVEPVALSDVVEAVGLALESESSGHIYYLTGASRVTWRDVVKMWARSSGSQRWFVPLPGWGHRPLVALGSALGRLPRAKTAILVETLRDRQVCPDPSLRYPLGRRPLTLEAAMQAVREVT